MTNDNVQSNPTPLRTPEDKQTQDSKQVQDGKCELSSSFKVPYSIRCLIVTSPMPPKLSHTACAPGFFCWQFVHYCCRFHSCLRCVSKWRWCSSCKAGKKILRCWSGVSNQTVAHISLLCLVCHHWHANIVGFSPAPCKESPCTWSGICCTIKWQLASFHSQCITAQICTVYNTNSQKDEGYHSIPLPHWPGGSEDTLLSSDCQASHGLFHYRMQIIGF